MACLFAVAALVLHVAGIAQYGYFRDELYYLACTEHMAWGYVDQPPLSIAALWLVRHTLGDSLLAIRLLPALIHAAVVLLAAGIARDLGGGRAARALAAAGVALAPMYLGITHAYSINAWDLLAWASSFALLLRALARGGTRNWMLLGLVLGLGLLNKISVLWLGLGVFAGLLLTPHRRALRTRGPWIAAAIAGVVFLPHLRWQVANGWPTFEFMANAQRVKMAGAGFAKFVTDQVLSMNPIAIVLWAGGLAYGLFSRGGRHGHAPAAGGPVGRVFAISYLVVFALLASPGRSRASYLAPAYVPLFALGGIAVERLAAALRGLRWVPVAVGVAVSGSGVLLAPLAVPLLPVERFIQYQRAAGVTPRSEERLGVAELPQHYADMFGWEEMARAVAEAWRALPPEDRARCRVFAQNYGEAGAIDFFGRRLGLPRVLCGHNSYWHWGTHGWDGSVMLVIGGDADQMAREYGSVEQVGVIRGQYAMPYERDLPIHLCRGFKAPVAEAWPRARFYI
jgi:4-amino-4-deoxy-L-arabinose transferase-like glycosyltransferase